MPNTLFDISSLSVLVWTQGPSLFVASWCHIFFGHLIACTIDLKSLSGSKILCSIQLTMEEPGELHRLVLWWILCSTNLVNDSVWAAMSWALQMAAATWTLQIYFNQIFLAVPIFVLNQDQHVDQRSHLGLPYDASMDRLGAIWLH